MEHPAASTALWPLTAAAIHDLVGGELRGAPGAEVLRVNTDSRSGVRTGDLFVGLRGPHFDGGRFAGAALSEGARVAIVSGEVDPPALASGQAAVVVDDPLVALHALAAESRQRFRGTVVAITGSNGKTIVKDMLSAALSADRRVTASPMSYNSQVGVALTLLQLDPTAEVALVECGISLPGEMARLEAMVRPDLGLLTHLGDAHREGLGDRETTVREKATLFRGIGSRGWVLAHHTEARALREVLAAEVQVQVVGGPGAAFGLEPGEGGWRLVGGDVELCLALEAAPEFLVRDAALAAAAAVLLGARPEAVERGLHGWQPAPMRLEISTTPRGVLLLNDAYSADPDSVEGALGALQREQSTGRSVAVLGGMAQLGMMRREAHQRVGRRLVELGVDLVVGVGPGGAEIAEAAVEAGQPAAAVFTAEDVAEAAAILDELLLPGDRVLLKGSRPVRLERLAPLFFDALAPARLYVDLDEVVANYQRARAVLPEGCGVMAVVKSFGYGLDAVRVARVLERAGVEAFAVAYPDEGVALRDRGITRPILVQNVLEHEAHKVVRHALTAQVSAASQVRWLAVEAGLHRRVVRVHLKLDTGMGRAGALPERALELASAVHAEPWLLLEGLMTHFAASDEPARDGFTRAQIACFADALATLQAAGLSPRWVHACNSAGIARFPEAHHSMVRLGLGLFGYVAVGGSPLLGQQPVLRLVTRVVSVKEVPADHFVGYGLTFHTGSRPRRVAVVAVGYNDGYPWSLSNHGWMAVRGVRCPVVGRVCMDVTMLDVTELGLAVVPGDEVVVFGTRPGEPSLVQMAERAGTIPYELLTRLSPRLRRIFRSSL